MQVLRLKTREQFQAVLAGSTVARTEHFVMHRMTLDFPSATPLTEQGPSAVFDAQGPWLGAMVPKRWARRAVTRNLIKRQIYSVGMLHSAGLPPAAFLVRLRSTFDRQQFRSASSEPLRKAVRSEIEQLFSKTVKTQVAA